MGLQLAHRACRPSRGLPRGPHMSCLPSEDTAHLASTAPWQLSQIIYSLSFPKYCQERKDLLLHLGAIRQLVGTVEALRELCLTTDDRASREIWLLRGALTSSFYADPACGCPFVCVRLHAGVGKARCIPQAASLQPEASACCGKEPPLCWTCLP